MVEPKHSRVPAGRMDGDTLRLSLVVRLANWFPGNESGSSVAVAALAEAGKAPQIPGPLIRVPEGAVIDVTVRSDLSDSAVRLVGLVTRPADADSGFPLDPGATTRLRFAAGAP